MAILDDRRLEFVAKIEADLGKATFAVAVASYFFERFLIHPKQQGGK